MDVQQIRQLGRLSEEVLKLATKANIAHNCDRGDQAAEFRALAVAKAEELQALCARVGAFFEPPPTPAHVLRVAA